MTKRAEAKPKNLSHVPCKFHRQGNCLAGTACPFSHQGEPSRCQYFIKGNCRFGEKCALAHIEEGSNARRKETRNKTTSFAGQRDRLGSQGREIRSGGGKRVEPVEVARGAFAVESNGPVSFVANGAVGGGSDLAGGNNSVHNFQRSYSFPSNHALPPSAFEGLSFSYTSNPPTAPPLSLTPLSVSLYTASSYRMDSSVCKSTPIYSWNSLLDESAISDEEDGMFEDMVPSLLSDLLTPQELKRRGSRSYREEPFYMELQE